jgi:hypothetical protein
MRGGRMTPTPPQKEYIITEGELQFLKPDVADGMYRSTIEKNQEKIIFKVLSRPAPSPQPKCIVCVLTPGSCLSQHDTTIRNATETTDNILSVLKKRYRNEMAIQDYIEMIECEVMSLRTNQEPHP